ncbi:N-acetylmuramoyl-L-alanine amidase [Hydrococcus rivularis NIES-593]|uniref:N-acetylmuramoyl-L-alanine amidase n=1 Tax=Hydrococcus rivularis NIES-593 TaxID=1921803 RepID=A0A1U7HR28_9CYAN|nr:N-acetylmuramoyl-L-alanine amidase [Hydrococcus rivularis]OKH25985.1 N-acetylmuramoyl-L-alanine amidase [Hydrococcus rivularis NIES-593]
MKVYWLLPSFISLFLFASPAEAGRLLSWRFETNQSRLIFTTDSGVQPKAQLISDPTRVLIDLPGIILGRPSVRQAYGGTVSSVRVGQFDEQTTRLVIELAPGYTLDPQQVRIRGLSPTQWTLDLPTPSNSPDTIPSRSISTPVLVASRKPTDTTDFQVTRNGFFIRLDRDGDNSKIRIKRSRDRSSIEISLDGATLPATLASRTLPVNSYGVKDIQFSQTSTAPPSAKITLNVDKESQDWQAIYSRFGGLVLMPRGGVSAWERDRVSQIQMEEANDDSDSDIAIIKSLELDSDMNRLLIRSDGQINGTANWNRLEDRYEIHIPNARLSDSFPELVLDRNSPIYEVTLRQEDDRTVVIFIKPAIGVRVGQLQPLEDELLGLELRSLKASNPPPTTTNSDSEPIPIPVPPPAETSPSTSLPNTPQTDILVFIDPGHGGQDPGAIGLGGLREKDVILSISQEVARLLEQQGVRVMMARNSDYFVSLQGRTDMANRAGADLFVSIHANSMGEGRPDVSGLEVYYFGNRTLADTIHRSILRTVNVSDRGVRKARFYVLRKSSMPATLVEVGFVTGYRDAANLKNPTYRRQMALAIARGVIEYIQQNKQ